MELDKVQIIQSALLEWFVQHGRPFPWRREGASNFELIISEILLQRTRANTVSKYYRYFFDRFPSWEILADASEENLRLFLRPFGLNNLKASRLYRLAQQIKSRQGVFPNEKDMVRELSLFGQYTVNAFELFILKRPAALLDVNMARLLERYFEPRVLKDYRFDKKLNEIAEKVTNHPNSKELNWAILDFATLVCTSKNPACSNCPLNLKCNYLHSSRLKH